MNRTAASGLLAIAGVLVTSCRAAPPPYPEAAFTAAPASRAARVTIAAAPPPFACSTNQSISYGPTVPGDNTRMTDQSDADCFAWQEFVSLNWPVDSTRFGAPGDATPVQWETFMNSALVFQPGAATPPAWGTQPSVPDSCQTTPSLPALRLPGAVRSLQMVTKASGAFVPTSVSQAAPFDKPAWLGAQNGTNVWYEIVVDQDEYNYLTQNHLYNASTQASFVDNGAGQAVLLPMGTRSNSTIGAIELKAAWMEITDPTNPKWAQRYKLAASTVLDPETGKCRNIVIALVGLHILHKTTSQTSWVWATFEQVDNAPDASGGGTPPAGGYNFYNPQCQPKVVDHIPAACMLPGSPSSVTIGCEPNQSPPYYLLPGCPGPVPIQVTRTTPIDPTTTAVNQAMQGNIASNYPGSVWQYYELVNTIWSTASAPQTPPPPPQKAKAVQLNAMQPVGVYPFPSQLAVANTVLETYAQGTTCIQCHINATLAEVGGVESPWFADFSFLLGDAGTPPGVSRARRRPPLN